jgi:hypothetical protein
MKADKGKIIVIIDNKTLDQKLETFLWGKQFYTIRQRQNIQIPKSNSANTL